MIKIFNNNLNNEFSFTNNTLKIKPLTKLLIKGPLWLIQKESIIQLHVMFYIQQNPLVLIP